MMVCVCLSQGAIITLQQNCLPCSLPNKTFWNAFTRAICLNKAEEFNSKSSVCLGFLDGRVTYIRSFTICTAFHIIIII